jgi:hypothetical protein
LLVILATFIGLFFAIFPRSDKQLNSSVEKIAIDTESLTSAFGIKSNAKDGFALKINGQIITQYPQGTEKIDALKCPLVRIPQSREIFIQALNLKDYEVDKLFVTLTTPLADTEVNMEEQWGKPTFLLSNVLGNVFTWKIVSNSPIGGNACFNTTSFSISTNYQKSYIPARIDIDGSGRKTQKYMVVFTF